MHVASCPLAGVVAIRACIGVRVMDWRSASPRTQEHDGRDPSQHGAQCECPRNDSHGLERGPNEKVRPRDQDADGNPESRAARCTVVPAPSYRGHSALHNRRFHQCALTSEVSGAQLHGAAWPTITFGPRGAMQLRVRLHRPVMPRPCRRARPKGTGAAPNEDASARELGSALTPHCWRRPCEQARRQTDGRVERFTG